MISNNRLEAIAVLTSESGRSRQAGEGRDALSGVVRAGVS